MWLNVTILGTFIGVVGTTIGGLLSVKNREKSFIALMMGIAGGVMLALILVDLIPESMGHNKSVGIIGIGVGILFMYGCQFAVKKVTPDGNSMMKVAWVVFFGVAVHNFFEGVAVGASISHSINAGVSISLAILLHDIPEGLAIGMPMRNSNKTMIQVAKYCIISGLPTGFGTLAGYFFGEISPYTMVLSLAFAGGAMMFIVYELFSQSFIIDMKKGLIGGTIGTVLALILFKLI